MDFINGFDRNQLLMMDFEAAVSQESWARAVDLFVDMLPMDELGFIDVLRQEGRPPYRSSDLLKLYIYGYKNQLRSSRKLEHATRVNIEVIWLLKGLNPIGSKNSLLQKK
tara:strand:- start:1213 stop:1542 length:330 start_codon:yes stop_codon:yes gene_type:complete